MKKNLKAGVLLLCIIASLLLLLQSVTKVDAGQQIENQKQLEDSIHKAIMTCYATEGFYPPTMDYLEQNYGVLIDEEYYTVFYEIFADNIMPTVTVIAKK